MAAPLDSKNGLADSLPPLRSLTRFPTENFDMPLPNTQPHRNAPPPAPMPDRSGFSLVELLVAIAVIGILAAILIPVTGQIRQNARSSGDATNLRSIAMANQLYAHDHGGRTVVVYTPWSHPDPSRVWYEELRPYVDRIKQREGVTEVFISPCDPTDGGITGPNALPSDDWRRRSYSVNYNTRIYIGGGDYEGRPMITMKPAEMIFAGNHKAVALNTNGIFPIIDASLEAIPRDWHAEPGTAQFVFLDGHVEMIPVADLMPGGDRFDNWSAYTFEP